MIGPALAEGVVTWFGGSGRRPPAYEYSNGSAILVGGLDQPGKLLSTEYDRVFIDEASQVSESAVQVISTRLRGTAPTYKQLIMATNPDHPQHHLLLMTQEGRARMIKSYHVDNPRFMNADGTLTPDGVSYMPFLDGLTGTNRLRYRDGLWVARDGQVYDSWDETANLVDPFDVPPEWPLLISIDWGYAHPLVVQFWRLDGDGRMYLTHEIARSGLLVEDVARRVKDMLASGAFPRPTAVVADHDAEDRATFNRHSGLTVTPAYKVVSRGVQLVQSRLRRAGDGKPRLLVFRDALMEADPIALNRKQPRGVAAEVGGYVWMMERGTDGIPRESPKKENDDSCDAMRYAVAHMDRHEPSKIGNPAAPQQTQPNPASPWSRPVGR